MKYNKVICICLFFSCLC